MGKIEKTDTRRGNRVMGERFFYFYFFCILVSRVRKELGSINVEGKDPIHKVLGNVPVVQSTL